MELHATDRTATADGWIPDSIFSNTQNIAGVICFYVVGMHKVKVGPVVDAVEEGVFARSFNLIPADLRHSWTSIGETHYSAAHQSETFVNSELMALIEHELKSNAEADNWFGLFYSLEDQIVHSRLAEARRALAKRADARQDQSSRVPYPSRIVSNNSFSPNSLKGLFDAAQVPHSVIDYRNHSSGFLFRP